MLFKVHSDIASGDLDFFELNPGARAIEEFNRCTSRQMFTVSLIADRDYDSPLRTLDESSRRKEAVRIAGYGMEGSRPDKNARDIINGKTKSVEEAITKYREIQYDLDRDMHDAVDRQIQDTLDLMKMDKKEACKVKRTKTDQRGNTTTEEYIDMEKVAKLIKEANSLGVKLPELREAKIKLYEIIRVSSPIQDVTTFTAQDIAMSDDYDDEDMSTLDKFMAHKEKQKTDGTNN